MITPFPAPTRTPLVGSDGYITRPWSAFFDRFFAANSGEVPVAVVMEYAGSEPPFGWLLCDGAAISRSDYSDLFAAIKTNFGTGDGSTTFNLPDRRGRFPVGADGIYSLGSTGGDSEYTILKDNLPNIALPVTDPGHTHDFTADPHHHTITDPGHVHGSNFYADGAAVLATGADAATVEANTDSATTGITINDTTITGVNADSPTGISVQLDGGGQAFSLLPPFIAMNYIIKY